MFKFLKKFFSLFKISKIIEKNFEDVSIDPNISENKAVFVFDQSKELLKSVREANDNLRGKIGIILSFLFTCVSVTFFSVFKYIDNKKISIFLIIVSIFYTIIAVRLIINGFLPKKESRSGEAPQSLLNNDFISQSFHLVLIGMCVNIQRKIDFNSQVNEKLSSSIKSAIYSLITISFASAVYIIFLLV